MISRSFKFLLLMCILLLSATLNAAIFLDDDLDGVANEDDRCPHSKITDIVDKNGCAIDKVVFKKEHHIDISVGIGREKVANSNWQTNKNISFGYYYGNANFWLTYSKYDNSIYNNLTIATYYFWEIDKSLITLGTGAYIPTDSDSSNNTDYFLSLKYSYLFDNSYVSAGYIHIFSKDANSKDTNSITLEYGYLITSKLSLALSYKLESSKYSNESNIQTIGVFGNYNINKHWYISAQIDKDLSNSSNLSYSFNVGYYY